MDPMLLGEVKARLEIIEQRQQSMASDLAVIRRTMDEASGGMRVLRWMGFGSLASFIAGAAAIWHYLKGFGS